MIHSPLGQHLRAANLTTPNLWFGVYDFNDEAKTGKNWRLIDETSKKANRVLMAEYLLRTDRPHTLNKQIEM